VMDKITEEALRRLRISGAREGEPSKKLPEEEMQALKKSVENALRSNNPFLMQMLLMGLVVSQALAPYVEHHIRKENEKVPDRNTINLTEIAKSESPTS
jgi:hypothetical protein